MAQYSSHGNLLRYSLLRSQQNNRYYNQDLHQAYDPHRLAPRASARTLRPPTRLWLKLPASRRTIGGLLEHRPFSGLVHSAGELLHSLADSNFHGHGPAV